MARKDTGSEILTKVQQATELVKKGTSLTEVWKTVGISKQTYTCWKEICDGIQSELRTQSESTSKKQVSLDQQVIQMMDKLKEIQGQVRKYKRQLKTTISSVETVPPIQEELARANDQITQLRDKYKKSRNEIQKYKRQLKGANTKAESADQTILTLQKELEVAEVKRLQFAPPKKDRNQVQTESAKPKKRTDETNCPCDKLHKTVAGKDPSVKIKAGVQNQFPKAEDQLDNNRKADSQPKTQSQIHQQIRDHGPADGSKLCDRGKKYTGIGQLFQNTRNLCNGRAYPIGIDFEDESITLVQLSRRKDAVGLVDARKVMAPDGIDVESSDWSKWMVSSLKDIVRISNFKNHEVALALPVRYTYIDHCIIPQSESLDYPSEIFRQIQKKLPYKATRENTIIKHISTDGDYVVAFAVERQCIEHYLAVCEMAKLKPKLFTVWPLAMTNCYSSLWNQNDESFTMLFDVALDYTNMVICRDTSLYYARTIPIGVRDLERAYMLDILIEQIAASRLSFANCYGAPPIKRCIFLAGQEANHEIFTRIALQSAIPAQMGNPFGVIKFAKGGLEALDTNNIRPCWSAAFGLSLDRNWSNLVSSKTDVPTNKATFPHKS